MLRSVVVLSAWVGLTAGLACDGDPVAGPSDVVRFSTGFESGLDGFAPDGADLDDPPVEWSVARSNERAESGAWSVRLQLENLNDAGKIWLERPFELEPGRTYDVAIAFDFASADFGDINLWTIVAGASGEDPEDRDDLVSRDDTGNGADADVGYVWERKEYAFAGETGGDGALWIHLGVWGTSEFGRTYFVDDVEIVITPR
jgi:hypothetical protein